MKEGRYTRDGLLAAFKYAPETEAPGIFTKASGASSGPPRPGRALVKPIALCTPRML